MAPRKPVDPAELRDALRRVVPWVCGDADDKPPRTDLAAAVRSSARTLEQIAPGSSVEVRIPPFVAVQCIEGPRHTRGTPPNVVETDPLTWLRLVTGRLGFEDAVSSGAVEASGSRTGELAHWLPLLRL
ncbi:sterol carrier family protein [Rhodococcus chondri]|uniref:Sterol carrier family protein n=1 Tax=Rhodococcus chondri TaxID=3065941 RepID=A0ABU7JRX6_9NOCA|nr:sterol carrier family protein [Rhodococcus sp. CC-R104]MEE2032512.1 sterol carrier family protein [Rhodococcus sp. CC-R104]